MDHERFDDLTRAIAARLPRRAALRALAAVAATPLALLGAAETVGKGKKKKGKKRKNRNKKKPNKSPRAACRLETDCAECKTCLDGTCVDLFPLCDVEACEAAECIPATRTWQCTDGCAQIGGECCGGDCLDPCPSGQPRNAGDCSCPQVCPPGRELCEDIQEPRDPCCQVGEVCCGRGRCCGTDEHCCPVGPDGPRDTDCCPNDATCYRSHFNRTECCPNDWLRCEDHGCFPPVNSLGSPHFCCNDGLSGACPEGTQCCVLGGDFPYCCPAVDFVCDESEPIGCRYVG